MRRPYERRSSHPTGRARARDSGERESPRRRPERPAGATARPAAVARRVPAQGRSPTGRSHSSPRRGTTAPGRSFPGRRSRERASARPAAGWTAGSVNRDRRLQPRRIGHRRNKRCRAGRGNPHRSGCRPRRARRSRSRPPAARRAALPGHGWRGRCCACRACRRNSRRARNSMRCGRWGRRRPRARRQEERRSSRCRSVGSNSSNVLPYGFGLQLAFLIAGACFAMPSSSGMAASNWSSASISSSCAERPLMAQARRSLR